MMHIKYIHFSLPLIFVRALHLASLHLPKPQLFLFCFTASWYFPKRLYWGRNWGVVEGGVEIEEESGSSLAEVDGKGPKRSLRSISCPSDTPRRGERKSPIPTLSSRLWQPTSWARGEGRYLLHNLRETRGVKPLLSISLVHWTWGRSRPPVTYPSITENRISRKDHGDKIGSNGYWFSDRGQANENRKCSNKLFPQSIIDNNLL